MSMINPAIELTVISQSKENGINFRKSIHYDYPQSLNQHSMNKFFFQFSHNSGHLKKKKEFEFKISHTRGPHNFLFIYQAFLLNCKKKKKLIHYSSFQLH